MSTSQQKTVRMLVKVETPDGQTWYEWRDVPGYEIDLSAATPLKNGDTLTVDCTITS